MSITKPQSQSIDNEIYEVRSAAYWTGFLARTLVMVIKSRNIASARATAIRNLRTFLLRFDDVPDEMRRQWLDDIKKGG